MHVALLNALDLRLRGAQIVVVGAGPAADELAAAALDLPFLDRSALRAPNAESLPPTHPARHKIAAAVGAAAFVCVGEVCSLPVTKPDQVSVARNQVSGESSPS